MRRVVTMGDIERLSKESARKLYGSEVVDQPIEPQPGEQVKHSKTEISGSDLESFISPIIEQDITNPRLVTALKVIRTQSSNDLPFLFRSESAVLAGVKGAATLQAAEKEALMASFIQRHEIAKAKTKVILWEILERGYELIKIDRPKWKSKGDYKHKFSVHRIAHTFSQQGYQGTIEHRRPNGKLVDLLLAKDSEAIYVEVCASFPVEKELINVEKNLDGLPIPTKMYLAVTDCKMKKPLTAALQDFTNGYSIPCPIEVILAGDLIGPVGVPQ